MSLGEISHENLEPKPSRDRQGTGKRATFFFLRFLSGAARLEPPYILDVSV